MFYSFKRGQDFSLAASDGYRMLIMSCRFTITSAYSPTVGHLFANTVSGKLAHYAIAMRLAKSLNCISNVTDMIASNCHFDTFIQRLSCHCQ